MSPPRRWSLPRRAQNDTERIVNAQQVALLSLTLVVALGMLWMSSRLSNDYAVTVVASIATGLLVSASFGFAQAFIVGRATTEVLQHAVVGEVRASLSASAREFYPTHDIPGTTTPNPLFNSLLNSDLDKSNIYWFVGMSARFTASRLQANRRASLQVIAILPDLTAEGSLDTRMDYIERHDLLPGLLRDELRAQTEKDMKIGLVGLIEARARCHSLQVVLTPTPVLDRYEIFRDAVWITLYSAAGLGTPYPRALRFTSESYIYGIQEFEALQAARSEHNRLVPIPRTQKLPQRCELLEVLMGNLAPSLIMHLSRNNTKSFAGPLKSRRRSGSENAGLARSSRAPGSGGWRSRYLSCNEGTR